MLIVFMAIQFIRPARNENGQAFSADAPNNFDIPENILTILKRSCFDCHSNNTRYPWYAHIQPIGWLVAKDIKDGKAKLNFGELGDLSPRRKATKLQEMKNRIKDGTMPLPGYIFLHRDARLSKADTELILEWIEDVDRIGKVLLKL